MVSTSQNILQGKTSNVVETVRFAVCNSLPSTPMEVWKFHKIEKQHKTITRHLELLFIPNETVSLRVSENYEFDKYWKHSPKYIHTVLAQYFIYTIQIKFLISNFILINHQLNAIRISVKDYKRGKKKHYKRTF